MVGKTLSHFRIVAKVGEGGMGVVYKAEDEKLRRPVALKVLPPDLVGDEERRLRFLREARAAAAVTHPNIATIYEVGEADGEVFIAMEYLEGKTLRALIGGRPLPVKETLRVATQVADGMARAHAAGVVHRDLKPDNIMVGADHHVKILDFGLAKLLEDNALPGDAAHSRLRTISGDMTREGRVLGTASYMSPEQARGQVIDARSDLFSFGIVLYEMATGRLPFEGKTSADLLSAIIRDQPDPPTQAQPGTPAELERIIAKCLEKDPDERYQHADEMAVDLKRLRRTTESSGAQAVRTPSGATAHAARDTGAGPAVGRSILKLTRSWYVALPVLAVLGAGGFFAWRTWRLPVAFRPGDAIVVGEFENLTGRPEFDPAVREAFEDMLGLWSQNRIIRGEALEGLASGAPGGVVPVLSRDNLARMCAGGRCAGYLIGRIANDGEGYRIAVDLHRAGSERIVASTDVRAGGESEVLAALHDLALDVRRRLGEPAAHLALTIPPTTRSLAAFQAFAASHESTDLNQELALLRKAIEIDPEFVTAYLHAGINAQNLGHWREYLRWTEEAYRRRDRTSVPERMIIEAQYLDATYEFDQEIEILKAMAGLYPTFSLPADWLAWHQNHTFQDPVAAESVYRRAYGITPSLHGAATLASTLTAQGKSAELAALIEDFRRRGASTVALGELNLERQLLAENWPEARAMVEALNEPGSRRAGATRSYLFGLMASGQLAEARNFSGEAWRAADEAKALGGTGWVAMMQAWLDRGRGLPARLASHQVPQMERSFMVLPNLALVSVELGAPEPLASIFRSHETELRDSRSRFVVQEMQFIRGCQALIAGRPEEARTLLEPLAHNSILLRRHHALATTYEALGKWAEAAAEYEEILKYPHRRGYLAIPTLMALDRYRAARVYERLENKERARHWYTQFLEGWKDADPDIPEFVDAKQRLAALGGPATPSQ